MAKILAVEDSPPFQGALAMYLRNRGYDVTCADDGELALRLLREEPAIALVILDLVVPKFDGVDIVAAIRSDPATQKLPVIVITAADHPVLRRHLRPSVQEWLVKGNVSLAELLECVRRHLPGGTPR